MINVESLWKKRYQFFAAEIQRYTRLIFNDHLRIVLVFAIGGAAFYYQQWLKQIPEDFPAIFVISLLLGICLTYSPIRTFLKEADLVFLLPIETKLDPYFKKSLMFSITTQSYILIIISVVLAPLYFHVESITIAQYVFFVLFLLLGKAWNVFLSWQMLFFADRLSLKADAIIRFTVNVVFVFLLFSKAKGIFLLLIGLIMVLLLLYFKKATRKKSIKWETLIELDNRRLMFFYRIANLFTDVPALKNEVKHRKALNWVSDSIPFSQSTAFDYLYVKSFIRGSDYFGVYSRLLIISGLCLYFFPFYYGKLLAYFLFLYLAAFQLVPLYRQHVVKVWVDLYPISRKAKQTSFLRVLFRLTTIFSILTSSVFLVSKEWMLAIITLPTGLAFSYLYLQYYVKRKLNSYDVM